MAAFYDTLPLMPTASISVACSSTHPQLKAGQERVVHVLVQVKAGLPDGKRARPRLSTMLALDVSGSMQGQPLEHVVRSAERILELLADGDSVGVVAFSSNATLTAPLSPLVPASRRRVQDALRRLTAEGGTNISSGMNCAADQFPQRASGEQQLVLLLSDGQPNVGPSSPRELASEAGRIRARGVAVSTLGYGAHHDEKVLINIAELGGGRYAFVSEPQLAEASFVQALGAQLDVVLEAPLLVLTPSEDADIVRVLGEYRTSIGADGLRVPLRNLIAGDELNLVVEMRVRAWREGDWRLLYATLTGQDAERGASFHAKAQAGLAVASEDQTDLDALAMVGVALADEQRTKARGIADRGDFRGAAALLKQALQVIEQTPGFQRGKGDRLDDAYDALLDDVTVYEQHPDAERYAHYTKAQQDFHSLSKGGASYRMMSPTAQVMNATRNAQAPSVAPARLVVEAGPQVGRRHPLDEGRVVIGRGVSCDLPVASPNLSRQHAMVERLDDGFWLVDMGSTNGVVVKGRRVQRHLLLPGDQFELGDVRFRFEQD